MEPLRDYEYDAMRLAIQQNNNRALIAYKTNAAINMRTVASIRTQDRDNLAIFREIYGHGPDRQPRPAEPAVQDPRDPPDRDRRDYGRNREDNEQRKVEGFKTKFRLLASDLDGKIEEMSLGNVKHNTRQIEKLIETHDKLYAELSDVELLSHVTVDIEDLAGLIATVRLEPYPSMRKWSADLYDREQALKDESTLNTEQRRREDKDKGDIIKQESILIKLTGESSSGWTDYPGSEVICQRIPHSSNSLFSSKEAL
jgi:hypothetical protein